MAKKDFGAVKAKSEADRRNSNPGGLREAGMPFTHFVFGKRKHIAIFDATQGSQLRCSVCGEIV